VSEEEFSPEMLIFKVKDVSHGEIGQGFSEQAEKCKMHAEGSTTSANKHCGNYFRGNKR
jgi:hypothetical protein